MQDFWINGQPGNQIDATDRGLMFGDGFFTTMAVRCRHIENLNYHQQRVENSLYRLGIDFSASSVWLFVNKLATSLVNGGIKLVITRGSGGQGYQLPDPVHPSWIVTTFSFPERYKHWQKVGIRLGVASTKLGIGCSYSDLKTLNRLEQVAIKREIDVHQYDDLVVSDINGNIVEASAANIFWRRGRDIFTPELSLAGIHGVMRERLLRLFDEEEFKAFSFHKGRYRLSELRSADEIWLSNSLMPIIPIASFEREKYSDFSFSHYLLEYLGYPLS
ncbi:MAG: Aminodeoxychorismate lyase [Candidatus Celerinatantimonas neptuna]|nr:MAG: Aminodeoxychorismate lyase [Candidatus Celerinatantimonas neptuna]